MQLRQNIKSGGTALAAIKTNAMRLLEKAGIPYRIHPYEVGNEVPDGVAVAGKIGKPVEQVFKTLVTVGSSRESYVFVIPVAKELDLKTAARTAGEKSVSMLKVSESEKTTGYIRGGCSPLGMKKDFQTFFDISAQMHETIVVSSGKIGYQMEVESNALIGLCQGKLAEITHQA
jgi:Cys-tRNA(Pro)/Cys-tRNA(Cys) deacylase